MCLLCQAQQEDSSSPGAAGDMVVQARWLPSTDLSCLVAKRSIRFPLAVHVAAPLDR